MEVRAFNSIVPRLHQEWCASVLDMQTNPRKGPDLIDDNKIVEVKFCLVNNQRGYPLSWTVMEHQVRYKNGNEGYWALGLYWFDQEIKRIRLVDLDLIEKNIRQREVYIVQWDWMNQYVPHNTSGETERSKWENTFRYPKFKNLPRKIRTYEVKKGLVHLTEGVPKSEFNLS